MKGALGGLWPLWLGALVSGAAVPSHNATIPSNSTSPPPISPNGNLFESITPSEDLEWIPCFDKTPAAKFRNITCARLKAPIDYDDPCAGEVQLAIVRLAPFSPNEASRSVFFNPGGPEGDPIPSLLQGTEHIMSYVGNNTEVVGVVPRGVGATLPAMTCEESDEAGDQTQSEVVAIYPEGNASSVDTLLSIADRWGQKCRTLGSGLSKYTGTVNTARDIDFVLRKMGGQKLSYLGGSYGTLLGATYATLFPDKIDRMVLDAVADPSKYFHAVRDPYAWLADTDASLEYFFQTCFEPGQQRCAFWSESVEKVRSNFFAIKAPPNRTDHDMLSSAWRGIVHYNLYNSSTSFRELANTTSLFIKHLSEPDSPGPEAPKPNETEIYTGDFRLVDPTTGLQNSRHMTNNFMMITCLDGGIDPNANLYELYHKNKQASDFFGTGFFVQGAMCIGAKLEANHRSPGPIKNITTSNPILFVSSGKDPITPLISAQNAHKLFPGSGLLVTNGVGHGSRGSDPKGVCARE